MVKMQFQNINIQNSSICFISKKRMIYGQIHGQTKFANLNLLSINGYSYIFS